MEQSPERRPEQLVLSRDEQYQIVASSILFRLMKTVGKNVEITKPAPSLPSEAEIATTVCHLAYKDPASIEAYLNDEFQRGLHNAYTQADGSINVSPRTFHVENVGLQLQIVDRNMQLTTRFAGAVGLASNDRTWAEIGRLNNLKRFTDIQKEIATYFTPTVLSTDNGVLSQEFRNVLRDAEFYAAQYDPDRL